MFAVPSDFVVHSFISTLIKAYAALFLQDYVISVARKHNVRVLISFTTFWQNGDGILAYAKWAKLTYPITQNTPYYTEQWAAKDKFWTSGKARAYYKSNMKALFNRRNIFTGELTAPSFALWLPTETGLLSSNLKLRN